MINQSAPRKVGSYVRVPLQTPIQLTATVEPFLPTPPEIITARSEWARRPARKTATNMGMSFTSVERPGICPSKSSRTFNTVSIVLHELGSLPIIATHLQRAFTKRTTIAQQTMQPKHTAPTDFPERKILQGCHKFQGSLTRRSSRFLKHFQGSLTQKK